MASKANLWFPRQQSQIPFFGLVNLFLFINGLDS